MNQILVTKKLYITPELKRKKKIYKVNFILSVFLICILTTLCIYAEYDRNKSEETSQEILSDVNKKINEMEEDTLSKKDILLVVLDGNEEDYNVTNLQQEEVDIAKINAQAEKKQTASGYTYKTIATIKIPKINVNYAVLQGDTGSLKETEALLQISPCKFHGYDPNEVGNFCIVGHNWRNTKFFSKVPTLEIGDKVELTDLSNRTIVYEVYDIHTVMPDDTHDTTQVTDGRKEVTLITCTDDSKLRVIVRCKEVK